MDQIKFIYTSKQIKPAGEVTDDGNGGVAVLLRPGVVVTHKYKRNNQMTITFTEDESEYIIGTDKELEEIYRMHLSNVNFIQPARKYCDDHLQRADAAVK